MNVDELLNKAQQILDDYEKYSGLPTFEVFDTKEIDAYFKLNISQLNKLSALECANISYVLAEYSFYLQRIYNRESAKNKWGNTKLSELICDKLNSYDKYTKHDYKVALIAKENEVVKQINSVINYTNQTMERLNFLSNSVKHMSDIMSNIQKAKSYDRMNKNE